MLAIAVSLVLAVAAGCGEIQTPTAIDAPASTIDAADTPIDAPGSCTDGTRNGNETDVDCGGSCSACADTRTCALATDCTSGVCTNTVCQAPSCSDGVRNANELDVDCAGHCGARSCDANQACGGNADCASNLCTNAVCVQPKRVFVSSAIYSAGEIGNLAGGDAKCQAMASAASLTGTYRAWLSSSSVSAAARMTQASVPYVLVDGTQVGDNFADLLDSTLDNAINRTETGAVPAASEAICDAATEWVHTGTRADGTLYDANNNCTNFTVNTGGGAFGKFNSLGGSWTIACGGGAPVNYCGKRAHIYCIEQ
jgi:hypothetical protein